MRNDMALFHIYYHADVTYYFSPARCVPWDAIIFILVFAKKKKKGKVKLIQMKIIL